MTPSRLQSYSRAWFARSVLSLRNQGTIRRVPFRELSRADHMLAVRAVSTVVQYFGLTKLTSLNFYCPIFRFDKSNEPCIGYIADPNLQKAWNIQELPR